MEKVYALYMGEETATAILPVDTVTAMLEALRTFEVEMKKDLF